VGATPETAEADGTAGALAGLDGKEPGLGIRDGLPPEAELTADVLAEAEAGR
jgi:hypothetical protein